MRKRLEPIPAVSKATPRPLPTLPEGSGDTGEVAQSSPSMGDLVSMIALQMKVVEGLRPCESTRCDEYRRALFVLELLQRELNDRPPPDLARVHSSLDAARAQADVLNFVVPPSHRRRVGKAVTSAKKAFIEGLKPFHVELLKPQASFNGELVKVLYHIVATRRTSQTPVDLSGWVKKRLGPLMEPKRWVVRSHRGGGLGGAVDLAKRTYLSAVKPVVGGLLEAQKRWNAEVVSVLQRIGSKTPPDAAEALELLANVDRLCDPFAGNLFFPVVASTPLWKEVWRRQISFNREVMLTLADLMAVRVPAPGGEARVVSYARWLEERPSNREASGAQDGADEEAVEVVVASADLRPRDRAQKERPWVLVIDEAVKLTPGALARIAAWGRQHPHVRALYSDEDRLDAEGGREKPFFKPDWSPELTRAVDYVGPFLALRRDLFDELGGLRTEFGAAMIYDLLLRASERTQAIGHVPEVLWHFRRLSGKRRHGELGLRALQDHLSRTSAGAVAEVAPTVPGPRPGEPAFRVRYPVRGSPRVSIIIPFRDRPALLARLLDTLLSRTRYTNFELLLVSNDSQSPETFALLDRQTDPRIRAISWDAPFHYPKLNNDAARQATGELLLFLNNDMEVVDPAWLDELVGHAQRPEVGAVGPMLLFPDGLVQHAGVVVGIQGFAGHPFWRLAPDVDHTPFGSPRWSRDFLAVTSACVLIRREVFDALGGFDESFVLCGSDVDLGIRLRAAGKGVVYTAHTRLVHHESASRRLDAIPPQDFWNSFVAYRPYLKGGDPFYNPNLTLLGTDCALREDERSGEVLASGALALQSRSKPLANHQRAHAQRHAIDHVFGLDATQEVSRKARQEGPDRLARLRQKGRLDRVDWMVPPFEHPFGGLHTIFRFADFLSRRHGVTNTFVVYDSPNSVEREIAARVSVLYPELPGHFKVLKDPSDLRKLGPCDLVVSTFWTGAYLALQHPQATVRAYLVQDYEPLFYPAGTFFALAEETYRMGFFGLFNSPGLHDFVTRHYPMDGVWFEPAVDPAVFHARRPRREGPVRIFFYGRPSTDRNGFELGAAALGLLKRELGARIEIVSAGEAWDPDVYGVSGVIANLGVLPYEGTGDLYRSCDIGLCFMFTKHPSYLPLEMMACGVAVLTNDNPANHWLLEDGRNSILVPPTASAVAQGLRRLVEDAPLRERLALEGARRVAKNSWESEMEKLYAGLMGRT